MMGQEYIQIARHFVQEVLETYEAWIGKDGVPPKVQELIMVLQNELYNRHKRMTYVSKTMDYRVDAKPIAKDGVGEPLTG